MKLRKFLVRGWGEASGVPPRRSANARERLSLHPPPPPPPIVVFIAVIFLILRRSISRNLKFGSIPWSLGP